MRYAVFTDVHANLEALEAVLEKIDEIAAQEPIDAIWFLGDLVGYGPDPNECIVRLRERTDVIIAGNHDWAAVGKIDLEEFSPAARISAEWTAEQLTAEHRAFLENLPERLEIGECTLVHGSPFGPLWEYLTREDQALAERSFDYFTSRYCFVGHTHVPVIFQQPDVANSPTMPLGDTGEFEAIINFHTNGLDSHLADESANDDDETTELASVRSLAQQLLTAQADDENAASAFAEPASNAGTETSEGQGDHDAERSQGGHKGRPYPATGDDEYSEDDDTTEPLFAGYGEESFVAEEPGVEQLALLEAEHLPPEVLPDNEANNELVVSEENGTRAQNDAMENDDETTEFTLATRGNVEDEQQDDAMQQLDFDDYMTYLVEQGEVDPATTESEIAEAEERLNGEIEELLTLLGLSQSLVTVTNEMIEPPEGHWELPVEYRAIVNPGGVGQPRDSDPRAAFMIYDTERGFEFYRVPYNFPKTQEKIINAGLPQFLAVRLEFGR